MSLCAHVFVVLLTKRYQHPLLAAAAAAAVIAVTPTDLMRFRPRYFDFLDYIFHYSLEIIFRNLNNSFLTSDTSLQAPF